MLSPTSYARGRETKTQKCEICFVILRIDKRGRVCVRERERENETRIYMTKLFQTISLFLSLS